MIDDLRHILLKWYAQNMRSLPWREGNDPYAIWISEVILQQTRVNQGIAYYKRFLEAWPDVKSLARASEQEVLKMWQGLGYYSRARNMLHTARQVVEQHNGLFPTSYEKLLKLKGIGPYTAAAIVSIAFGGRHATVDGNVARVLSRYFAVQCPVDGNEGKKEISRLAQQIVMKGNSGTINQAMMEFGALQCVPRLPDCANCPLQINCAAFQLDLVKKLPVKKKKKASVNRFFNYLVMIFRHENELCFVLRQRREKDIWEGLFEFPLIETEAEQGFEAVLQNDLFKEITQEKPFAVIGRPVDFKQILSHQNIYARFYLLFFEYDYFSENRNNVFLMNQNRQADYPLHRLIQKYLLFLNDQNLPLTL